MGGEGSCWGQGSVPQSRVGVEGRCGPQSCLHVSGLGQLTLITLGHSASVLPSRCSSLLGGVRVKRESLPS